jgi:hypothetical protein
MEMYCDETGRGGVLEPNGIVEVKYKDKDLVKTMHRLDEKLKQLDKLAAAKPPEEELKKLKDQIATRERHLTPTYEQVAIGFADLHDTPGRMLAKGVINKILTWKTSRAFFYNRVRRRLEEESIKRQMLAVQSGLSNTELTQILQGLLTASNIKWEDDCAVFKWFEENQPAVQQHLKVMSAKSIQQQVQLLTKQDPLASVEAVLQILSSLPAEQKSALLEKLKSVS